MRGIVNSKPAVPGETRMGSLKLTNFTFQFATLKANKRLKRMQTEF